MHPADLIDRLDDPHRRMVLSDRQEAAHYIRKLQEAIANAEAMGRGACSPWAEALLVEAAELHRARHSAPVA